MKQIKLGHRKHLQHCKPAHVPARDCLHQHSCGWMASSANSMKDTCSARHGLIVHDLCLSTTDVAWPPPAASLKGGRQHVIGCSRHWRVGHSGQSRRPLGDAHPSGANDTGHGLLDLAAIVLVIGRGVIVVSTVVRSPVLLLCLGYDRQRDGRKLSGLRYCDGSRGGLFSGFASSLGLF
ncbi:hypothetical protein GY45DRAFT_99783 [Cubamyces sp. BRFM 1775]|nr:hypothetical protein GY45DRAFT_99783 [Cubamyces sp. BRFM 1775]